MAFRKVHDSFWTDPDMEEFTPEQKFFYLYLITNPSVNQIGLYEFSVRRACFETGYNSETIEKLLSFFEERDKIKRSEITREILVVKFWWHNKSNSPKVLKHVEGLLSEIKDTSLIGGIYGLDTVSIEYQAASQKEEEKEKKENKKREKEEGPSRSFILQVFKESNFPKSEAQKFFDYYSARNWKIEGNRIINLKSLAKTWMLRKHQFETNNGSELRANADAYKER